MSDENENEIDPEDVVEVEEGQDDEEIAKILVVEQRPDGSLGERRLDLQHSTVGREYEMARPTFCYYQEVDDHTVFSGLQRSPFDGLRVFVKLVDNEPVDMNIEEWQAQWQRHPEFIEED